MVSYIFCTHQFIFFV